MLNIPLIHEEIDKFTMLGGPESYHIDIPEQKPRGYLGLSGLGAECRRSVWYEFRKVAKKSFPSRMLRLFRTGDIYEYRFIYLLRGIGFEIFDKDENGKQFKITDFEGHLSGSMDGAGKAPAKFGYDKPFLLEFKTYNDERFNKLKKNKVKINDPKYYVQCQGYMGYNELEGCLFCAVNKNDDELYFEWVPFDKHAFRRLVENAEDILTADVPPPRIRNNPAWWQCKFCDFHSVCHKGAPSDKSCRSCKFASPGPDKSWVCAKGKKFGEVCKLWKDIAK
jgi:hypothetical protein